MLWKQPANARSKCKKTRQPHVVSFGIYVLIDPRHEKLGNPMAAMSACRVTGIDLEGGAGLAARAWSPRNIGHRVARTVPDGSSSRHTQHWPVTRLPLGIIGPI
jgi:hypothetical protein